MLRRWVTGTFAGRALALGATVKLLALGLGLAARGSTTVAVIDTAADVSLVAGAAALAWRTFMDFRRLLLWRVRRKLTISYIFMGFVPALLIITFFLLSGFLMMLNVGAYVMKTRLDIIVEQAHFLADSAAIELQQAEDLGDAAVVLQRRQAAAATRNPLASFALVNGRCDGGAAPGGTARAGPWTHTPPVPAMPGWVPCEGYAGLLSYQAAGETRAVARAVSWTANAPIRGAVVVDIPLDAATVTRLREETGITLYGVTPVQPSGGLGGSGRRLPAPGLLLGRFGEQMPWPMFIPYRAWDSGDERTLMVEFRMAFGEVYTRLSATQGRFDDLTFGQIILVLLVVVAALFFIIQLVAFAMGLGLARSITGAIHELFVGTERIRRGQFSHKIAVLTRDQLGELAMSFNSMTASIENLLQEKAEKERLEQELRIARQIQMSLLPQATLSRPGLGLLAHCEPAREVGGDYYDFLPVGDALGILVADVSGKGTSAALYMAELKGIVLSLSQLHTSPRQLLIDANRIISRHLDSRSFITVSYLLVDVAARTLRYSRAGHCPMIYVPGPYAASRAPRVLAPDGMVLGLTIDDGTLFTRLLEEITLPLGTGDLFLLYTDGMSEAMNADGDCFGDDRLAGVVGAHADLPSDELMARILEEVTAFAGTADQQDDMTMVLIRVEESGVVSVA